MEKQKKEGIKGVGREIEREFSKYGFAPFKLEEISIGDTKGSVLQIVADWLYEMVNDIVGHMEEETTRIREESRKYTHRNIKKGVNAVLLHETTFTNMCTMRGRGVEVGIEYYCDGGCRILGAKDSSHWARITIIEERKGSHAEIFFAKYWWADMVDLESVRISTSFQARNAFQLLQEKHRET